MIERHIVVVPKLGKSSKHATLVAWHKAPGDWVTRGMLICTVETRKAAYDILSDGDGFLTHLVPEGTVVKTGDALAVLSSELEAAETVQTWLEQSA